MKTTTGKPRLVVGAPLALALVAGLGYVALAQDGGTTLVKLLDSASHPLSGPVTLEAVAPEGYEFDHWEVNGQDVGSDNPVSIELDGDNEIRAVLVESAESTSIHVSSFRATAALAAWYRWTGLGLLVAAAIGAILRLDRTKEA